MSVVLLLPPDEPTLIERWQTALDEALPDMPVWRDAEVPDAADVRYAVVWQPPAGRIATFPNVRAVLNLGAGVDAILRDATLPAELPVCRLADAGMAPQMTEYCLYGVLHFHRRFDDYRRFQETAAWHELPPPITSRRRVGILGMGVLGGHLANVLTSLGFAVHGWSRSAKDVPGVTMFHGREKLGSFLGECEILVNLLPLTDDTRGLLNRERLSLLPTGACLVNAARGAHVVEDDLLAMLDAGHLRGALLDVMSIEPLPAGHALWHHPRVVLTPHVAAQTLIGPAVEQVVANIRRMEGGEAPLNAVDRARGY